MYRIQADSDPRAIKLTVNDMVRKKVTDPETGRISLGWEFVAGGTAGGCQVVSDLLQMLSRRPIDIGRYKSS